MRRGVRCFALACGVFSFVVTQAATAGDRNVKKGTRRMEKRDDPKVEITTHNQSGGTNIGIQNNNYYPRTDPAPEATPSSHPKFKVTRHQPPAGTDNGATIVLTIESDHRLVPWRAVLKQSEASLLAGATTGSAGFVQGMTTDLHPVDGDLATSPLGPVHFVGSDDAIVPGRAIYLYLTKLPSALWVGSGGSVWTVDLPKSDGPNDP